MAGGAAHDDGFALVLYTNTAPNETTVSVRCGDITLEAVDAIASSANGELLHEDGVAGAIARAGGDSIQGESDEIVQERGPLDVTEVVCTGAGNLPCRRVLHVVCPLWRADSGDDVTDQLFQCCGNLLKAASNETNSTSLAIPALGTGICGIPAKVCAGTMRDAVNDFIDNQTSQDSLRDIRFVGLDWDTMVIFQKAFEVEGSSGIQESEEPDEDPEY